MLSHLVLTRRKKTGINASIVCEKLDFKRTDLLHHNDPLQLALLYLHKNETFQPHVHPPRHVNVSTTHTLEGWVILKGKVQVIMYTRSQREIGKVILRTNEIVLTINGGHNYIAKSKNVIVAEFKSGPYDPIFDKLRFNSIN